MISSGFERKDGLPYREYPIINRFENGLLPIALPKDHFFPT